MPHPLEVRGQVGRGQAQGAAGAPEEGRPGRRRAHVSGFDLLAVQHPRLGRGAQSGGAGVRDRAGERQARAVRRPGQDRARGQGASGTARQDQRAGGAGAAARRAQGGRQDACASAPARRVWFTRKLKGGKARVVRATDPCILPKARKNATEIKGARAAHKRDGAAVARFLAWLDREAETGGIDEIAAAQQLETMRSETQALKEISFDTISGSGPERRHRALPRHHGDQPQAEVRRAVSRRFRRAVSRRHHRRHAHGRHRHADARDAASASRWCSRATSPSRRRASPRARAASISTRSRAGRCGRRASTSTTAPATASAAICRCTRGRRASPRAAWWRWSPA